MPPKKPRASRAKKAVPEPEPQPAPEPLPLPEPEPAPAPEPEPEPDGGGHVILQLPIAAARVEEITRGAAAAAADPSPWSPCAPWTVEYAPCGDAAADAPPAGRPGAACFWCCHPVPGRKFGMPLDYSPSHRIFTVYGTFCSLECAAAHNMATHVGSDRLWDVHAWIQMLAKMHGLPLPVRPAPSRYVLRLFGGPLDVDEFRAAHRTSARTVVLNVPPLVSVQAQVESVNTSFLAADAGGKVKLSRRKAVVDHRKTLEAKMNLSYSAADGSAPAPPAAI